MHVQFCSGKLKYKYNIKYFTYPFPLYLVGDNLDAAENFERFYELSKEHVDWVSDDGIKLHVQACCHLSRIYTKLAEQEERRGDLEQYQALLEKAYQMAKEGKKVNSYL